MDRSRPNSLAIIILVLAIGSSAAAADRCIDTTRYREFLAERPPISDPATMAATSAMGPPPGGDHNVGDEWAFSFIERLEIASRSWWFYLSKTVFPWKLTFIYPRFAIEGVSLLGCGLAAAGVALLAGCVRFRDRIGRGPLAGL